MSRIKSIFSLFVNYKQIAASSKYLFVLFLFAFFAGHSQNITIRGKAHGSYAGKKIRLGSLSDNITAIVQTEDQDTIETDGFFELRMQSDITRPVFLRIDNVLAKLYVQPDFVYGITIPELEQSANYNNGADLNVNIGIVGTDSTELNVMIFDYEEQFNRLFAPDDSRFLSRPAMFKRTDSLRKICAKRYKNNTNEYFKTYVAYSIASIDASVSRGENFLINGYIVNKPILYQHYEYMQFFNTCFSGYLKAAASSHKDQTLFNIINIKQDYKLLVNFLKDDKFLKKDSILELVIIKNLWDCYFSPEFEQDGVKSIISQLNLATANKEHKRITSTMLAYFNKMQPGSMAPGFSARSKDGTVGTLAAYKNRWVYLNFFSTKNTESLKEMPKIVALKKKFGDKVSFISICVDDSLKSYKDYIRANPKQDWAIWYNDLASVAKTAKELYFVGGTEAYFLINNFGYLAQSPALPPSKGIEFKFNLLFKSGKNKNTKTGIR